MAGKVLKDEFIDYKGIMTYLDNIAAKVNEVKGIAAGIKGGRADSLGGTVKANKEVSATAAELAKQNKALHDTIIKLGVVHSEHNKELIKYQDLLKKEKAAILESITNKKADTEAAKKNAAELRRIEKERKDIIASRGALSKQQSREYLADLKKEEQALNQRVAASKQNDEQQNKYWQNRRKESASNLTAKNPVLQDMGAYYKKLEAESDKAIKIAGKSNLLIITENNNTKENIRIKQLQAIVNKEVAGSYNQLDAQYKLNIISLNKLTQEQIENSAAGKKLAGDTKVLHSQLQAMDQSTARNRNGYNGLRFSMMQVGRELPSMAYGINVFMAAISNNIPMVTDEIKKARMELAALKTEGKVGVPIWKQMVGAIFSWQTALVVGLTALTVYGKEIFAFVGKLLGAEKQLKATKIAQDSLTAAHKAAGESIIDEKTKLEFLYDASQDDTRSRKERLDAVNEMQKLYPDHLGNIEDEAFLAGEAADKYRELSDSILEAARASAIFDEIKNNEKKILPFEEKLMEARKNEENIKLKIIGLNKIIEKQKGNTFFDPSGINSMIGIASIELAKYQKQQENAINNIYALGKANDELAKQIKPSSIIKPDGNNGGKGGGSDKDTRIDDARKQNEIELQNYRKQLEESFRAYRESEAVKARDDETNKADFANRQDQMDKWMFDRALKLNNELTQYVREGTDDILEIKKDAAKLEADIAETINDNDIAAMDRINKLNEQKAKERSDNVIFHMESDINEQQLILIEGFEKEVKLKNLHGKKLLEAKKKLEEDLIQLRIDEITEELKLNTLTEEATEKYLLELGDLKEQLAKKDIDLTEKTEQEKLEILQKYADAGQDLVNAGFDFTRQAYDNQLAHAERTHEIEMQSAVESVEGRMLADAKLDKKKRELAKKEAILKKAQGAFNIIVDTAQAVMEVAPEPIMMALVGAAGLLALGTVLAEPIPAYAKGVKGSKGGVALMGEKGSELVEEPSGKTWLTDSKPTVYSLPEGSNVFPSDETQKLLAQQAFNNSFNIIGLSETNNLLNSINKNTKEQVWFEGNYKVVKHGTITTRYDTGRR